MLRISSPPSAVYTTLCFTEKPGLQRTAFQKMFYTLLHTPLYTVFYFMLCSIEALYSRGALQLCSQNPDKCTIPGQTSSWAFIVFQSSGRTL